MQEIFLTFRDNNYLVSNCGTVKTIPHTILRSDGKPHPIQETILRPAIDKKGITWNHI